MDLLNTFVVLLIVIDPIAVVWLFAVITRDYPAKEQRHMANLGVFLSAIILAVFYFAGEALFKILGISIPAFRITGGILLFLVAMDMVFARHSGIRSTTQSERIEAESKHDISVFPLAFPLIAGPGAITTVLLMSSSAQNLWAFWGMFGVLLLVLLLTLGTLWLAPSLTRWLGETGSNVVSRILGIILCALAAQYVVDGIKASFTVGAPL